MSPAAPAAQPPQSPSEARPVEGHERIVLVDALRGFALFGVFLSNAFGWFDGRHFFSRAQLEAAAANASLLDTAAGYGISLFVNGKFITLFSFLFGLGFFVQMDRARARGGTIAPLYVRRLGVLLALGLAHLLLLWWGDILSLYALLGFCLLAFRSRSDRTLLVWAALLVLAGPVLVAAVLCLPELTSSPDVAAAISQANTARAEAIQSDLLQALTGGGYGDIFRAFSRFYSGVFFRTVLGGVSFILGRFLLGLFAGRRRLFHEAPGHLPFFRRLLGWGALAGAIGAGVSLSSEQLARRGLYDPGSSPWLSLSLIPFQQAADLGLAAVYASAFVLLFQRPLWRRLISALAPAGRMALSNYLAQSMLGVLLYYPFGLGLAGKLGPAACIGLTLALYALQVACSHLWLARFRFGPAEWLWRSLTYGKAQPMRRTIAPPDAGSAAAA